MMEAFLRDLWAYVTSYFTGTHGLNLMRATLLILFGFLAAKVLGRAISRLTASRLEAQQGTLLQRGFAYLIFSLFLIGALNEMGFNLGLLLGAAGILSVAIGFASQASASNLISGLFLIGERPFGIGDVIQVGETTGEVLSIDLLSVKLRTFDNLFVRIPNEILIKSEVRTLTKFPIRRVDLQIAVAYREDIPRVRDLLLEIADANPQCLEEPRPLFIFKGFGDSAIEIQFSPWTTREHYLEFKNAVQLEIKRRFEAEGIEIPFPHRSLYAGSRTAPLPIRIVSGDDGPPA
jgi:small-conductance mechanosensitive channel